MEEDSRHTMGQGPTLGQIAEILQAKARAEALAKGEDLLDDVESQYSDDGINASGAEQHGRWTAQEHKLFVEALKKFGKVPLFKLEFFNILLNSIYTYII